MCAIIFQYKHVLKMDICVIENLVWAKRPKILPGKAGTKRLVDDGMPKKKYGNYAIGMY